MAAHVWAAVLICCIHTSQGTSASQTPPLDKDLEAVLSSLTRVVNYYEINHSNLNLDGLFGLRVLEGQLMLLTTEYQRGKHKHVPKEMIDHMLNLKKMAGDTSAKAMESVRKEDSGYFENFKKVIDSPWNTKKPHRKVVPSLRWEIPQYKAKLAVKMTEESSDKCMIELLRATDKSCEISDACLKLMTARGLTGYQITHQLLWSNLAETRLSCHPVLEAALPEHEFANISAMQLEMCTNIFYEMLAVVQLLMHGKVHLSHQDLFLEQQFICSSLGFYEFLKKDYLHQIVSWQFPLGCFGEPVTDTEEKEEGEEGEDGMNPSEDIEKDEDKGEEEGLDLGELLEAYHEGKKKLVPEVLQADKKALNIMSSKKGESETRIQDPNIHREKNDEEKNKQHPHSLNVYGKERNVDGKGKVRQMPGVIVRKNSVQSLPSAQREAGHSLVINMNETKRAAEVKHANSDDLVNQNSQKIASFNQDVRKSKMGGILDVNIVNNLSRNVNNVKPVVFNEQNESLQQNVFSSQSKTMHQIKSASSKPVVVVSELRMDQQQLTNSQPEALNIQPLNKFSMQELGKANQGMLVEHEGGAVPLKLSLGSERLTHSKSKLNQEQLAFMRDSPKINMAMSQGNASQKLSQGNISTGNQRTGEQVSAQNSKMVKFEKSKVYEEKVSHDNPSQRNLEHNEGTFESKPLSSLKARRHLLVEKEMADGCLSHKTGVAAAALVMYLRYLIDPGEIKWTGQHELLLSDTRNLLQAPGGQSQLDVAEDGQKVEEEEEEDDDGEEDYMEKDEGRMGMEGGDGNVEFIEDENMDDGGNDDEGNKIEDAEEEEVVAGENNHLGVVEKEGEKDVGDEGNDVAGDYSQNINVEEHAVKNGKIRGEDSLGKSVDGKPVIRFGASRKSDTIVITEDSDRDTVDYANIDGKVLPIQHNKINTFRTVVDVADGQDEEERNYYDDESEVGERGFIKKRKPLTPRPHPPVIIRQKHNGAQSMTRESLYGQDLDGEDFSPGHPNYTVLLMVSMAPFLILFFFLLKFVRRRRVHIRYGF